MVDLSKTDVYPGTVIPDENVETCLKVLRTIRNFALHPGFDAEAAVLLSHAHKCIVDLVEEAQKDTKQ